MTEKNSEVQSFIPVIASELLGKVQDLKGSGYRLGQICASKVKDEFQILYSFDKDYQLLNLKMTANLDEEQPSITGVYWSAFIYENEIKDLFGFNFKNLVLDYGGHFIKTSMPTPWNPQAVSVKAGTEIEGSVVEQLSVGTGGPGIKVIRQSAVTEKTNAVEERPSSGVEKQSAKAIQQNAGVEKEDTKDE